MFPIKDLLNYALMLFWWGLSILLVSWAVDLIPGFDRMHGLIVACVILVCMFIRANCGMKRQ